MSNKRRYSLYQKEGRRWVRVSENAYSLPTARHVYQNRLLDRALNGVGPELRIRVCEQQL